MVARLSLLLVLLLAAPGWAQPRVSVTKTADVEEIIVEVNGVKAGFRSNVKGEKWELKHERNPLTLGMTKRLHAHKVGPLPNEKAPLPDPLGLRGLREPTPTERDMAADGVPVVIDVNFLYSASAASARGGEANMPAFAALACAVATQTASNSGSPNISYVCLGPFKASYLEATGGNPLAWMYNAPEVTVFREQTGADLSHMVTTNNACGQAYYCIDSRTGLSHSEQSCAVANLTFVHETGHNLCMSHEPASSNCPSGTGPGTPCPGSAYGHSWGPARDVLAYASAGGARVTQFSNPNVLHSGLPTGIAERRDNALALRSRAPMVAAFRQRMAIPQLPAAPSAFRVVPSVGLPSAPSAFRVVQ